MGSGASRLKTKPTTGLRTTIRNREAVIAVPRMNSLTLKLLPASKGLPSSHCLQPAGPSDRPGLHAKRGSAQLSVTMKGSSAMLRARLISTVNALWWSAQFPVMRRGMILPRSVTK